MIEELANECHGANRIFAKNVKFCEALYDRFFLIWKQYYFPTIKNDDEARNNTNVSSNSSNSEA